MKKPYIFKSTLAALALVAFSQVKAQTVFDVIAGSANHTLLEAALIQEGLDAALDDPMATLTVFAPDDNAINALAAALGTDISGLLANPELSDILTYHVLGTEVEAANISNGDIETPLNAANTIKLTVTTGGDVFANQAQVNAANLFGSNGVVHSIDAVILPYETVVDIALDNGFTYLATAVVQEELLPALTDPFASLTVFAPTNQAFDDLAAALGTNISGLLALPNLTDVLLYHVLGTEVLSGAIANGDIVSPLSSTNTLKLTVTSGSDVYVNQAQVTLADLTADNGAVHVLDAVVLPNETVADIAIDNGFTYLVTAVVQEELLPALTDPLADLTVFAPTNAAFDNLAVALGTDIAGLLALPNLTDVLLYHVLGTEVLSGAISNGDIVSPLSSSNTLKLTVTSGSDVYVNQAQVTLADLTADNGAVHVLDAVVLPVETVADVAIDNGFTSLTQAVVTAELLPALTDPLADLTVFAPTNAAFDALATALGTDLNGVLASPNLTDILLYHVVGTSALSTDLTNGPIATLNGQDVTITITGSDVDVNNANVTLADLTTFNGVVHVIDAVLVPSLANINETEMSDVVIYPNPSAGLVAVKGGKFDRIQVLDMTGRIVLDRGMELNEIIDLRNMEKGQYIIQLSGVNGTFQKSIHLLPGM